MNWRTATTTADTSGAIKLQDAYIDEEGRIISFEVGENKVEKWFNSSIPEVIYKRILEQIAYLFPSDFDGNITTSGDGDSWLNLNSSGLPTGSDWRYSFNLIKLDNGRLVIGFAGTSTFLRSCIFSSDDEGETWTLRSNDAFLSLRAMASDGTTVVWVSGASTQTVYKLVGDTVTNITSTVKTNGSGDNMDNVYGVCYDGTDFVFCGQSEEDMDWQTQAMVSWSSDLTTFSFGYMTLSGYGMYPQDAFVAIAYSPVENNYSTVLWNADYTEYDLYGDGYSYLDCLETSTIKTASPSMTNYDGFGADALEYTFYKFNNIFIPSFSVGLFSGSGTAWMCVDDDNPKFARYQTYNLTELSNKLNLYHVGDEPFLGSKTQQNILFVSAGDFSLAIGYMYDYEEGTGNEIKSIHVYYTEANQWGIASGRLNNSASWTEITSLLPSLSLGSDMYPSSDLYHSFLIKRSN